MCVCVSMYVCVDACVLEADKSSCMNIWLLLLLLLLMDDLWYCDGELSLVVIY